MIDIFIVKIGNTDVLKCISLNFSNFFIEESLRIFLENFIIFPRIRRLEGFVVTGFMRRLSCCQVDLAIFLALDLAYFFSESNWFVFVLCSVVDSIVSLTIRCWSRG